MTSAFAPSLAPGLRGESRVLVTPEMTALRVGSGTVPVYATPMLIALMEAAAVACVEKHLTPGHASLGTHLDASHIAATPVGLSVTAAAELVAVEGRKLTLQIEARDDVEIVGRAVHTRIIVDVGRFTQKLAQKMAGKDGL